MTETTETTARQRGAARFEELGRERYLLEERAEEQITALLETLGELREVDRVQRALLWTANSFDRQTARRTRLAQLIQGWLGARLGGDGGHAPLLRDPKFDRLLAALDPLATAPESTTEKEGA
jgi:hypothetical protein